VLYRVKAVEDRVGGFVVAVCSQLGQSFITTASYVSKGSYNAANDTILSGTPVVVKALIELVDTNFKFLVAAAEKYRAGDRIITVRKADITIPEPEDSIVVNGVKYKVISAQADDDGGCWEIHSRRF